MAHLILLFFQISIILISTIQFKELYAHKQLKAYRNLDGCQLYEAGYVEKVEFVPEIGDKDYCLVKCLVKSKQRKEDPINKTPFYKGWIVLDYVGPAIYSAFCACIGVSDGGCRHTVAVCLR